ncbi:MAG: RagB/SusD family nutrient uptake outer membrane protein [Prevotella sp.]|nr:RagB/SusD family nutrient uptake outer membrane protein [Prevotella sp.]
MKTNIKMFFAAALAAVTVGCTDLDVPVESQYTAYPGTEEALEAQMSGIFFQLRGTFGRRYMEAMALSSDEYTSVSYGGNWYDNGAYAHPSLHNFGYEDASIDWMGDLASGIVKANEIIDSDADETKYKAPARAMRAFFTFLMMDCWGDVPINDSKLASQIDIEKRQPRADVARWLESELKEIIPLLTTETTGDNYGKPNKYMAQALLAKLYINWAVYTATSVESYEANAANEKLADCISVCDEIIKSGKFALGPDAYRFKFASDNTERVEAGTVKDFIYAMPYHTTEQTGMQYGRSHSYKDIKNLNPSYYGEALTNSGGGYVTMTPEFVKLFNLKGDERNKLIVGLSESLDDYRYATGGDENNAYILDPETLLPTNQVAKDKEGNDLKLTRNITLVEQDFTINVGDNLTGWRQGCRNTKWHVTRNDYANGRNQSNDIPLLRYADVLLTKAEALTRQGSSAEAMNLVNQVRAYAGAEQLTGNPTLNDIYEERGREFFDENWRRNDMIRFGHFEDEFFPHYKNFPTANFDKTRRVFPVSKKMLDLNPKWEQNPGY